MATFDLPAVTLALWAASGAMPATESEIAAIAALSGAELPADYVAFLRMYGFVSWSDEVPARFDSTLGGGTVSELLRVQNMAYVMPDQVPEGFLPVAGEYGGHDLLLMRMSPPVGEIWHLNDSAEIARVAPDFTTFVEGLYSPRQPQTIRWTGTPERDPATGFVIAAETRAAWASYYTGSTPEPADELAAIEADLGRPLPEALRSFLTTYGYVTFFGPDIPVDFDLPPEAGAKRDTLSVIYSTAVLPRALPLAESAPLPFGSTARDGAEVLIGLGPKDEGRIYWRADDGAVPVPVADDLRSFLAGLYLERATQ